MFSGAHLRAWRERHGYTQIQLADILGIYANTLARWEQGTQTIAHPRQLALALLALEVADSSALAAIRKTTGPR